MFFLNENMEEILDRFIGGFRQYIFTPTPSLSYISSNLCQITGYTKDELTSETEDLFYKIVHPSDKHIYSDFLKSFTSDSQRSTAEYRIICKNGDIVFVSDTITTKRSTDGILFGYSVLTDITSLKAENNELRLLNETVPCGMLKYTCDKHPKVTYCNAQMMKILRIPETRDGEMDYLELYKDNIYLMIPMEERRRFSHFLDHVYTKGTPISGEISVLRGDGTKAYLYGWVTKTTNEQGKEEFQSVCMDITERYNIKRASVTERYLKALSDVYDKIFEYDFSNKTVKYVHGSNSPTFERLKNIPMQFEDATRQWLQNTVCADDRELVRDFFLRAFDRGAPSDPPGPKQIQFNATASNGEIRKYSGIFLKIDTDISLFCCRRTPTDADAISLMNENSSLKSMNENIKEMVMRFTDGIAAFEVKDDLVTPLYASDNVCEFFGFTKEEWLPLMRRSTPLKEFVARSGVGYNKFSELLANGEAEFTYMDLRKGINRQIKAICSQKHSTEQSPRYVMLYNLDRNNSTASDKPHIYVRTFGYFDVFVNDKPIAFRNKKAKELFALLIDRRGGYISSEEAIGFLWENEPVNAVTLARYRKEALRLKNTLDEYGISDVMESVDGKRRIVTEKLRCDLYDYLSAKEEYSQLFKGSYLTNYSWGENTLGELLGENM